MKDISDRYYEARGFSVYYMCNAVFNVVEDAGSYLRGIDDLLGDSKTEWLMVPFTKYTNLHGFIEGVTPHILTDEIRDGKEKPKVLKKFLDVYSVPYSEAVLEDEDAFWEFTSETDRYGDAVDELTDEVFHVLFNDVSFLQTFNGLCADFIRNSAFGAEYAKQDGTLKRVNIPKWARRAVFHRDRGECRSCKKSLAAIINPLDRECYDHIVPLALHGANDVTNLQLLCEPCNLRKLAKEVPASRLYQRAIPR